MSSIVYGMNFSTLYIQIYLVETKNVYFLPPQRYVTLLTAVRMFQHMSMLVVADFERL